MIHPVTIAHAATHAAALAAIHGAAFPAAPWTAATFTTLMAQPNVHALMHTRGGLILLRTAADEAEILTFAAHPPRQGAGRALLTAAIAAVPRPTASLPPHAVQPPYIDPPKPNRLHPAPPPSVKKPVMPGAAGYPRLFRP